MEGASVRRARTILLFVQRKCKGGGSKSKKSKNYISICSEEEQGWGKQV